MLNFRSEIDLNEYGGLSGSVKESLQDDALRAEFTALAVREYLLWLSGGPMAQSITEQQTERLANLFPLFFLDTAPTPARVFNHFAIPYGRAAYISRVLMEMDGAKWRANALKELHTALTAIEEDANNLIAENDPLERLEISISQAAYKELTVLLEIAIVNDNTLDTPVGKGGVTGRKVIEISAQLTLTILKLMR